MSGDVEIIETTQKSGISNLLENLFGTDLLGAIGEIIPIVLIVIISCIMIFIPITYSYIISRK